MRVSLEGGGAEQAGAHALAAVGVHAVHAEVDETTAPQGSGHEYVVVRSRVCGKVDAPAGVTCPEGQGAIFESFCTTGPGAAQRAAGGENGGEAAGGGADTGGGAITLGGVIGTLGGAGGGRGGAGGVIIDGGGGAGVGAAPP